MEVAEPGNYLESLDLQLKWENDKITVNVHFKSTNNFTHVLPTTCYTSKIPHVKHYHLDQFVIEMKNLNIKVKNIRTNIKGFSSRISRQTISQS